MLFDVVRIFLYKVMEIFSEELKNPEKQFLLMSLYDKLEAYYEMEAKKRETEDMRDRLEELRYENLKGKIEIEVRKALKSKELDTEDIDLKSIYLDEKESYLRWLNKRDVSDEQKRKNTS